MKTTIKYNGERYEVFTEQCEDSAELAVCLDLGNGRPEHIGYAENEAGAIELAKEELERLSE